MMRITDQYFWNIIFSCIFVLFVAIGTILVTRFGLYSVFRLSPFDLAIIILASQRLVRLFVYDNVMKWFREQFYDVRTRRGGKVTLHKPAIGPRRTVIDLLSCPWCFGMWATATVSFFYIVTPYAYYPILILALSSVVSIIQVITNWVGHNSENAKQRNVR